MKFSFPELGAFSNIVLISFQIIFGRFKDDGNGKLQPYPWSGESSSLILYPEAANQTIYSRSAAISDNGKYLCVLRNETHKMEHYIDLQIKSEYPYPVEWF